jgi:hypothetical protein
VIIGAHWFQYADQPVTGRLLDGENAHFGLVGITDIPFGSFVEAVGAANAAVQKPPREPRPHIAGSRRLESPAVSSR